MMPFIRIFFVVTLMFALRAASADGKLYASDYTPEIPDQRALIAFDGERQVMLIESRVSLPDGQPTTSLGWVVPVPNVPEVAVADRSSVLRMYRQLRRNTDPRTLSVVPLVAVLLPFAFLYVRDLRRNGHPDAPSLSASVWVGLIGCILASVSISDPPPIGDTPDIEIVKELRVGPLDAKIVRASSGSELVDWLQSNGFTYGKSDIKVIENYLQRKWLFVVAKLAPLPGTAFEGVSASPPIVLSFSTKEIVYPVLLTVTSGEALDLTLYVLAPTRVKPNVAMRTVFAGATYVRTDQLNMDGDKAAAALFAALNDSPSYVTKVSGNLPSDKISRDIVFNSAAGEGGFRDWALGPIFVFWVGGALFVGLVAFALQLSACGRWQVSGIAWFGISMSMSWLLAAPLVLGSVGRQYFQYRRERKAGASVPQ